MAYEVCGVGSFVSAAEKLPELLNVRGIMDETGLKRAGAEALMRALPKIEIPGHRSSYVHGRPIPCGTGAARRGGRAVKMLHNPAFLTSVFVAGRLRNQAVPACSSRPTARGTRRPVPPCGTGAAQRLVSRRCSAEAVSATGRAE